MPRLGKDACPFTGGKFASVSDGPDGSKVARTPVLRVPITLAGDLLRDLAAAQPEHRLAFRRWIADAIDQGELPDPLMARDLRDHRSHPAPNSESKALRLLAWMVDERAEKGDYGLKFDFSASRVGPMHEACLITEVEGRTELMVPLRQLRERGYVEYVDSRDRPAAKPTLLVRLTDEGREFAEAMPRGRIHRVSARLGSTKRVKRPREMPRIARDTSPVEFERIVVRTIDRSVMRDRIIAEGSDLVGLTDVLLASLERALAPTWPSNQPSEAIEDPETRERTDELRSHLVAFRIALVDAVSAPRHPTQAVVKQSGRLLGALKAVVDHPVGQTLILATSALGICKLADALGIPADTTWTIAVMVGGPKGAKVIADAAEKFGKGRT